MYGLGQMMQGMGGSAHDGAPQPGQGGADLGALLSQMLSGKGGIKMPLFANGPLGQALGSQGIPMGILGLLGQQLGK